MSSEGKYAKGNKYVADGMVTVLPSASPNRRFLAFILVAVALVALVILIAALIPIYVTGDGEDKENGQLSQRKRSNDSLANSSTRSIVIGSSTSRRHSFVSVSKFDVSTSKPQQGPSSRTTSPSEMMSSSPQVTRTTKSNPASVSSSSNFARSSSTQSNLDPVFDKSAISKAVFSLMSSPSLSSASTRGIIDISTSEHEERMSTTIIASGPSRQSTSVKTSVKATTASLPKTASLTTSARAVLYSSIETSAKATSDGFEPAESSGASLPTPAWLIATSSSVVLSSSIDERPSLSATSHSTTTGSVLALSSIAQLVPNSDAKWSRWSSWSDCTRTCGNGTRLRTRKCEAQNQLDVFAPIFCAGKHYQNKTCADWGCPDCSKICVKGTLNAKCDACTCGDHVLTGRVQTKKNAPLSEAEISLAETPYNVLAKTNATGFFTAFNVCADANQELFIAREGFVPVKVKATILTSTTANVKAALENAVPPSITVHPRSKMRISGHGVTFCCDGGGNPTPEFEWFKDNNIIDKDVYHYNKTLEISDVSGLMGGYRCRVVNDYGSEFSDVANLQVFNTSEESSCNPTPNTKNATLPSGCVVHGTTNNIVDVGQCLPKPCLRNDSALSNTACNDETFCCVAEAEEEVTITCGGVATFNISKVSRCGCQECEPPKAYMTGIVVGMNGAVEKPISYCEFKIGDDYYNADGKGAFKFEVPEDKQRLSAVFRDTYYNEFADFTKVFRIVQGQSLFSKIVLRVKPAPTPFNSSEPFKVSVGDGGDGSAFAEIEIPEGALLKDDGTIFTGQANLRMTVTDPRNATDVMTAPADFSTVDEDGEEQILVSYGMLSLDFEDDSGNKLSTSKSITLFLDPEKLNISVDSNGNTKTKLWWLDENTGRWMEAGDLWLDTKETSRSRRSPTRFLLTEITPVVQRQGSMNIDVRENFGAVRVAAPPGSTVRILCKEPNARGDQYAGYLEGAVDGNSVTCISVWINRECFMQAESSDARFLAPSQPDGFPSSVSARIIETQLQSVGSSAAVRSFSFNVRTDGNGPVYPHFDTDVQNCRAPQLITGHRQFQFTSPPSTGLDLTSSRPERPNFRDPLNWFPTNTNCFIKIVTTGQGSTFLASSYRANRKDNANKFGDSVAMANPASDADDTFVACLDIRCPGDVYHQDTNSHVPEWTYVLVTHLTGSCDFQSHNLQKQNNIDNNGANCPDSRSKRHASGSENWFCIPLPATGSFDIDNLYTSPRRDRQRGVNRCNTGNNQWQSGPSNPSRNSPTIVFTCS